MAEKGGAKDTVLVSACILGIRSRYDGTCRESSEVIARLVNSNVVPVCPEQLGGLPTPRAPCRIEGGSGKDVLAGRARVVDEGGADRTESFLRGAEEVARLAKTLGASRAVLMSGSPSCDASYGVTAARLFAEGLGLESVE